jgi:hypothetical protein
MRLPPGHDVIQCAPRAVPRAVGRCFPHGGRVAPALITWKHELPVSADRETCSALKPNEVTRAGDETESGGPSCEESHMPGCVLLFRVFTEGD